jgi:hypothetical protein
MLYVGGMLYDREPQRLVINELRRDFDSFFSDSLAVIIDTFLDRSTGYGFWISPGGARRDVQAFDNGRRNDANWDGVWLSRATVREDGWAFELAIPFKTLRFPDTGAQEWGLNLLRIINRKNEFALWSPVPRQFSHYSVAFAGLLTGIDHVARGRDLRVTPFTTARLDNGTTVEPGWGGEGDGGADLKWGITSSMLLDASYRTHFSQVEADAQQINLTSSVSSFRKSVSSFSRARRASRSVSRPSRISARPGAFLQPTDRPFVGRPADPGHRRLAPYEPGGSAGHRPADDADRPSPMPDLGPTSRLRVSPGRSRTRRRSGRSISDGKPRGPAASTA